MKKEDQSVQKQKLESGYSASHGYGGKFGVEKDRMDKSAVGHEYQVLNYPNYVLKNVLITLNYSPVFKNMLNYPNYIIKNVLIALNYSPVFKNMHHKKIMPLDLEGSMEYKKTDKTSLQLVGITLKRLIFIQFLIF